MFDIVQLKAADGFDSPAYVARPAGTARAAVVVVQEIFGVNSHIRAVADDYAQQGYLAIAPDAFHRIRAGVELGYEAGDVEQGRALKSAVEALPGAWCHPDIAAAIAYGASTATSAHRSMRAPRKPRGSSRWLYPRAILVEGRTLPRKRRAARKFSCTPPGGLAKPGLGAFMTSIVRWMLRRCRPGLTCPHGQLCPEWRALLLKYPQRFLIGSDTWVNQRWSSYDELMQGYRAWLGGLPAQVARQVTWGNAATLLGMP